MSTTDDIVVKKYQPPKPSHAITHYVVKLFKSRLNSTTHVGFHCHCGHESKVQFPDYRAMTLLRIRTVPDNICDLVLAAWRAHTKDLDGVHPNAEDQIRDFFNRQLEQPGGPTMTRYPLTAIPIDTPKPKSIAISAYVDENLRRIIIDYAEKLGIAVEPITGSEWLVTNVCADGYKDRNATPTAMREYLARLLYGDDGLVENLQADEANINEKLDEVVAELRREEAEQPISFPNEVSPPLAPNTAPLEAVEGFADKAHAKVCASTDRPTRIILRSYAADDKPRIERLLGLARQLQIPVQLAGSWSCTAFPKGEEAHPALDVVFPEALVHPRDVLILGQATSTYESGRSFGEELTHVENRLLWAARDDDQRFITGLIELLGLHAEASRGDIAAAVEAKGGDSEIGVITSHQLTECHRQRVRYEECDAQVREILGASQGEEAVEAAKRVMSGMRSVLTSVGVLNENLNRASNEAAQIAEALGIQYFCDEDFPELLQMAKNTAQKLNDWAERDERVRNILGAVDGEETDDAAKRVMADLAEWKRGQESWRNSAIALRQETAENLRKLLDILKAATGEPDWQRCLDYAEARMKNAAQFESEVAGALGLPTDTVQGNVIKWAKSLVGQNKYQAEKLAEALGYKSDDFSALLERVQCVIREHQTLLGERIESNAKIDRLCASLDRVVHERDGLKARLDKSSRYVEGVQKRLDDTEADRKSILLDLAEARVEIAKLRATRLPCGGCSTHLERAEKERDSLGEKLDNVHRGLAERLGLPKDTGWGGITSAVERIVEDSQDHAEVRANNKELGVKLSQANLTIEALRGTLSRAEKERDEAKERLETAIAAERQTIAQRIDLALTGNAVATHIDTMLRAVEHLAVSSKLLNLIADALDAPSEEKAFTNDDGSLNTALVDRIVGYYKRLYTAAGYSGHHMADGKKFLRTSTNTRGLNRKLP